MKTGDRIELIERCATRLVAGREWGDIDFILRQFGLPITDQWDGNGQASDARYQYARDMLGVYNGERDEELLELDDYLSGSTAPDPSHIPWEADSRFRVFITHVTREKAYATEIKRNLAASGIDAFVAHEDINPGEEWIRAIIAGLRSCDALVGLLHDGFRESDWCDQEVGIVFGRDKPVIPIRLDILPYGFFGMVQAVHGVGKQPDVVAGEIVDILLRDKRTLATMIEATVGMIPRAWSYQHANRLLATVIDHVHLTTRDHLATIESAAAANRQVREAMLLSSARIALADHLGPPPAEPASVLSYNADEEPF